MLRKPFFSILLLALFFSYALVSNAQITVDQSVLEFDPGQKTRDLEVRNSGNDKIYLDLKIAEIIDPHTSKPQRVELADPRTAPVLVSPEQLLVLPGQRKRVRLIMRESATNTDRVFRLSVKPYTGKVELGPGEEGKTTSGIKVLVGYEILLLSRPEELKPRMKVERSDSTLLITNTGNTNVLLRKIAQCERDGEDCIDLQPNRLYAGERLELKLPKKGSAEQYPVEIIQAVGLRSSRGTY
ncbi:MAG: molecular chaperone [Granulosicoccus sp.]